MPAEEHHVRGVDGVADEAVRAAHHQRLGRRDSVVCRAEIPGCRPGQEHRPNDAGRPQEVVGREAIIRDSSRPANVSQHGGPMEDGDSDDEGEEGQPAAEGRCAL